jgi:hypothetical protein
MRFVRFLVTVGVAALAGCGDPCDQPVTFSKVNSGVFKISCEFTSCHKADDAMNDLDLETDPYTALVNVTPFNKGAKASGWKRVAPGDLAHSYLFEKLTQNSLKDSLLGDRMPDTGQVLSDDQITSVQCWIQQGAKND